MIALGGFLHWLALLAFCSYEVFILEAYGPFFLATVGDFAVFASWLFP